MWTVTRIDDMYWTPASRLNAEAAFRERKGKNNFVEYEFRDYKGTLCTPSFVRTQTLTSILNRNHPWICCSSQPRDTRNQEGL